MTPQTAAHSLALRLGFWPVWSIYERPRDYPHGFIARMFVAKLGFVCPTFETVTGETLQQVRDGLPKGLHRIGRMAGDDPKIVEVWK